MVTRVDGTYENLQTVVGWFKREFLAAIRPGKWERPGPFGAAFGLRLKSGDSSEMLLRQLARYGALRSPPITALQHTLGQEVLRFWIAAWEYVLQPRDKSIHSEPQSRPAQGLRVIPAGHAERPVVRNLTNRAPEVIPNALHVLVGAAWIHLATWARIFWHSG